MASERHTLKVMRFSDESVGRFIGVYKKCYGEELSVGEARTMATNLIMVYRLILQPLPDDKTKGPSKEQPAARSEPEEA